MFPSNNLFSHITCPFFEVGLCERPRCHFNHSIKKVKEPIAISKDFNNSIKAGGSVGINVIPDLKNSSKDIPENKIIKNTENAKKIINVQDFSYKTKATTFSEENQNAKKSKKRLNSSSTTSRSVSNNSSLNLLDIADTNKNSKQVNSNEKNDSLTKINQVKINDEKDEECFIIFKKAKHNDSINEKNKSIMAISKISSAPIVNNMQQNLLGNSKVRIAHAKAQVTNIKKENLATSVVMAEEKVFVENDSNCKISQNIRQNFIDKLYLECKKIMKFDEAKMYVLSEEKLLRNKCSSNRIYLIRACNFINNIRKKKKVPTATLR